MGIQQMMLAGGAGPDEVATGGNVIVDSGPGSMRYHYFYGNGTFTTLPNWSVQANIIIVGGGGGGGVDCWGDHRGSGGGGAGGYYNYTNEPLVAGTPYGVSCAPGGGGAGST